MTSRPPVAPLLLTLAVIACPLKAQTAERYTLRGNEVAVYDPAGRVQVVAGSGTDVTVEVTRRGRDAGRLRVLTGSVRGHDALRVVPRGGELIYPELGRSSATTLRLNSDGTFGGNERGLFSVFSSDRVTIRGSGDGVEAWAELIVHVPAGHHLAVYVGAGAATARSVSSDLTFDTLAGEVTTEGTRGRLLIDTGSGPVRVRDARGAEVNLDTGAGGVDVQSVRADRLRVDTGSGGVRGGDLEASDVNIDTGAGGIHLGTVRARTLKLDTGSGSLDVELAGEVDHAKLDTGSGGITLRLPPTLGATLDIDAGSGGIHTDVPVQITRQESGHLTGRIGDGGGRIVIDAGSGGVHIVSAR